MAREPIVEKIILSNTENALDKKEKESSSENKVEYFVVKKETDDALKKPLKQTKDKQIPNNASVQTWQDKRAREIDNILATGLNDIFLKMNQQEQVIFKKVGEETVVKINTLLLETKVKVHKIVDLIKKWLKLIPGINKFFLEQEAKIKTDQIVKIKNKF